LDKLSAIEKSIEEREKRMNEATRLAEERATAMEKALKDFEERARAEEAERAVRQQMFELAAGPINSSRSMMSSTGPGTNRSARGNAQQGGGGGNNSARTPRSKRDNYDAPPSARSARDTAGIPPDAPKIKHDGQTWVQLWDPEENAYYWYCPKSKVVIYDYLVDDYLFVVLFYIRLNGRNPEKMPSQDMRVAVL